MQETIAAARSWYEESFAGLRTRRLLYPLVTASFAMGFIAFGLFALWVLASIVGGMVEAGGPLGFIHSWWGAVTGG
ncbi:hypothetical protein G3N55_02135 [Dissulfurirhabdus thermomarina]|uniref:Uncharacterized protein n=1 Tax=Dissulfurirhabdus thermomarina TaxID=1765737 RepID=A0A6N9TK63_DISTH|nr:hypothetical protein [Dissulfurirhabdus thermomarina]NDY41652.1 hypothetical protein [Dissulfurirhabdus thermomarina]NMX24344.1 hypothetical protein [Dissulfurirhabdus thermomarina]